MSKTRTGKAKGRLGQNEIRDKILKTFPELDGHVKGATMGEGGADIQLSPVARKVIDWDIEVKRRKTMKGIYDWYTQADKHGDGEPVVFLRQDRDKWLALVDADYLLKLESK